MKRIDPMRSYCMKLLHFFFVAIVCLCSVVARAQSSGPTMKAIVVHNYGGPGGLKYEDTQLPAPTDDQFPVGVISAGVNPADAMIRWVRVGKYEEAAVPMAQGADLAAVGGKTGAEMRN